MKKSSLLEKIKQVSHYAGMSGAQFTSEGEEEVVWQSDAPFILRHSTPPEDKLKFLRARKARERSLGRPINPFLPYDERTFVDSLSESHVCLLNKFNITRHHVMVVSKEYEPQMKVLSRHDFHAAWLTVQEMDGLSYYNGGEVAGASVDHKHLHVLPKDEIAVEGKLPLEYLMPAGEVTGFFKLPRWDFKHLAVGLNCTGGDSRGGEVDHVYSQYIELMGYLDLLDFNEENGVKGGYNLLMTSNWMVVVPREKRRSGSIDINALAFAGTMVVETDVQQLVVRHKGLLSMLSNVAVAG